MQSDFLNHTVIWLETFLASCLSTYPACTRNELQKSFKNICHQKLLLCGTHQPGLQIRLLHVVLMFFSNDPHQRCQAATFQHLPNVSLQITAQLAQSLIEERAVSRSILNRLLQNKCVAFSLLDKINSTIYETLLLQKF